jgi:hypothetical protein
VQQDIAHLEADRGPDRRSRLREQEQDGERSRVNPHHHRCGQLMFQIGGRFLWENAADKTAWLRRA